MLAKFAVACALLALPFARAASAQGVERVLVDKKRVADVQFHGTPWSVLRSGGIEGAGQQNQVYTSFEVAAGDWHARLRLSVGELGDKRSGFAFADDAFLGFDAHGKKLFVDGARFGGKVFEIADATRVWEPNRPFTLDVARRGSKVSFAIDEKPLYELDFHDGPVGRMAIHPGDTSLRLFEWRVIGSVAARKQSPDVEALREPIDRAIERGVAYLLSVQQRDGSWASGQPQYVSGQTALSLYALLKSGLAPTEPALARALRFLDTHPPFDTYSTGLTLIAYEATHDPKYKDRMRPLVKQLLQNQRQGLWSYPTGYDGRRWNSDLGGVDLSNSQYAVLGLRAASAAGIEIPPKTWLDLIDNVLRLQEPPKTIDVAVAEGETGTGKRTLAGFGYNFGAPAKGSMTSAGISALAIAREALGSKLAGAQAAEVQRSIQMGVAWLGHYFRADAHPFGDEPWLFYWLYGAERVGSLLDLDEFGAHAWYLEGARFLIGRQGGNGDWASNAGGNVRPQETDTCYALLFLERATAQRPTTAGAERSFFEPKREVQEDVRVAYSGRGTFEFWIGGFGDRVLAEHGGGELAGLRIAYVDYVSEGRVLAHVVGDPSRPWKDERFRAKFDLVYPGEYPVVARVYLVSPDAPADSTEATRSIESAVVRVRSLGTSAPWLDELVDLRTKNLLVDKGLTLTPSSINGEDQPHRAFDGLEGSRWMCKNDDPTPTLIVELAKPVQGSELRLYSHCTSPRLRGQHDVIRRVSVRVNRAKDLLEAVASEDELQALVLPLGRSTTVQRLEIRILDRIPGTVWPGYAGFTEIALFK
ncbi:MAG: terpene cyclase/mutase family protein [Planctomycetes bacterium]|nr:terpene cyclase/mutase family protein [Planctomycetota bacterium]